MPLIFEDDTQLSSPIKPQPKPKVVATPPALVVDHPRVIKPVDGKLSVEAIKETMPRGLIAYDRKCRPAKFRLYSLYERRADVLRIPFSGWSPKNRCWMLPASPETLRWLAHFFPEFRMTPEAFQIVGKLKAAYKIESAMLAELMTIKKGMKESVTTIQGLGKWQPWKNQQTCISFTETCWSYGYGAANFSEQGTGKTGATLIALDRYFATHPNAVAVVYCPCSTFYATWIKEVERFTKHIRPCVPQGDIPLRAQTVLHGQMYDWPEITEKWGYKATIFVKKKGRPNLFIVNHEAGRRGYKENPKEIRNDLTDALETVCQAAGEDSFVIADEIHKFSNAEARQTKAAAIVASAARFFVGMTGTPGMPQKYYGIFDLIDKRIFIINVGDFRRRYVKFADVGDYSKIVGYQNLDELHRRADQFSIRFKQEDCLEIPEYTVQEVSIDLSAEQNKFYKAIEDDLEKFYQDNPMTRASLNSKLHLFRNITGGFYKGEDGSYVRFKENAKLDAMIEDAEAEMEPNPNHPEHIRKIVIACQYREEVALIEERLLALEKDEWAGIEHLIVTGDVTDTGSKKARSECVQRFVEDPKARVFLGTEAAIKEGLNLVPTLPQVCDVLYNYSLGFKPEDFDQLIKRIIRAGQTRKVRIKQLLGKGSVDETIADALAQKQNICDIVTGDNLRSMLRGRSP
jgi:hypothetical protein